MEANELRIGNYINCPNEKQNPFRIDWFEYLTKDKCKIVMETMPNTHGLTWELKEIEPIPLTEEWLIKFGFKLAYSAIHNNRHIWNKDDFQIEFDNGSIFIQGLEFNHVKFVHLLQNTYLCFKNKELCVDTKGQSI